MIDSIRKTVAESLDLERSFFAANEDRIATLARTICSVLEQGNKILLYGNGGSAADAQHLAAEWIGRFHRKRKPLAAVALTTDSSVLTCIGNDYGYDQVFARQVRGLGRAGDIAIALSTSGNSPNVLVATSVAADMGLITAGFTGKDGGKLKPMVQHNIHVPHQSTARVQEIHIIVGHILCQLVDEHMKGL